MSTYYNCVKHSSQVEAQAAYQQALAARDNVVIRSVDSYKLMQTHWLNYTKIA